MSIFSEYKYGYMSDEEFESAMAELNMQGREERRMMDVSMDEECEDEE